MKGSASPKTKSPLAELSRLRDEVRVRLHLATLEAKAQWDALETKLSQLENDPTLRADTTMSAAAELLIESARQFRSALAKHDRPKQLAGEIMTASPKTCRATDSLAEAARLMWEADCGAIPVVDEQGRPVSIITDRDICMAAYFQRLSLLEANVGSAMSRALHVCSADDDIGRVEERFAALQIRRMPVVDGTGRLVGIVALGDVARAVAARAGAAAESDLAQTVAAISKPRTARSQVSLRKTEGEATETPNASAG